MCNFILITGNRKNLQCLSARNDEWCYLHDPNSNKIHTKRGRPKIIITEKDLKIKRQMQNKIYYDKIRKLIKDTLPRSQDSDLSVEI